MLKCICCDIMSMEFRARMVANNLPLTEERNARYVYHFFQLKIDHNQNYNGLHQYFLFCCPMEYPSRPQMRHNGETRWCSTAELVVVKTLLWSLPGLLLSQSRLGFLTIYTFNSVHQPKNISISYLCERRGKSAVGHMPPFSPK